MTGGVTQGLEKHGIFIQRMWDLGDPFAQSLSLKSGVDGLRCKLFLGVEGKDFVEARRFSTRFGAKSFGVDSPDHEVTGTESWM